MTPFIQMEYDKIMLEYEHEIWHGKTEGQRYAWYTAQLDLLMARCAEDQDAAELNSRKWDHIDWFDLKVDINATIDLTDSADRAIRS